MSQKVYVFTRDLGDGSSAVGYTRDPDYLRKHEDDDDLAMNEGFSDTLEFPHTLNLVDCGFNFSE